jgi:hypothetical protein
VRFHNLRSKFGWQAWMSARKELVAKLLEDQDILVQPPLADAALDDWIMRSMPIIPSPVETTHQEATGHREWNRFYRAKPSPSRQDLLDEATRLDQKYGHEFTPPVK